MTSIVETHYHNLGDTLTPIQAQLLIDGYPYSGLSGKSVEFKMVNDAGTTKVDWTAGSIVDANLATVQYDFASADVDTAGTYWAWFRVVDGSEYDTWPKTADSSDKSRGWKVVITTVG